MSVHIDLHPSLKLLHNISQYGFTMAIQPFITVLLYIQVVLFYFSTTDYAGKNIFVHVPSDPCLSVSLEQRYIEKQSHWVIENE